MRSRRRRLTLDGSELNLVPLLDMVSLLIQLMLINARFGVFTQVDGTVGAAGPSTAPGAELALLVRVGDDGYTVSWKDGQERVRERVACKDAVCTDVASYDVDALRGLVTPLKRRFPNEVNALVVPEQGVPFEAVVSTLDALRGEAEDPLFPQVVFPESTP